MNQNSNRKSISKSIIYLILLAGVLSISLCAHGQSKFDRYNSRTKFNPTDNESSSSESNAGTMSNDGDGSEEDYSDGEDSESDSESSGGGGKDYFGRDKSNNNVKDLKNDNQYVNLNPETAFGPEVITSFNFPDISISDLTKHMQKLTGINLILDKEIKGKISIIAPTPITVGDAWKAYLTALNANNLSILKSGAFYRIVSTNDLKGANTPMYTGDFTPDTDNFVMRLMQLKYITARNVSNAYRNFHSRAGRILPIDDTNNIIIMDTGANVNRLVQLIKFIDIPGHEDQLYIIKVKNSSAAEIAKLLDQIYNKNNNKNKFSSAKVENRISITRVIPETRTNSIIALANEEGYKNLKSTVEKLDVKLVANSSGKIQVYYLNHGDAETLAKTLTTLTSGASRGGFTSRFPSASASANQATKLFDSEVKITADKSNNAIVVTASPTDYLLIKEVIRKLDIPKDQVYIESIIMETTITKENAFGVSMLGAYGSGAMNRFGSGDGTGITNLITNQFTNISQFFYGAGLGKKVNIDVGGKQIAVNSVNALIKAVASDSSTNVLATPQVLALDNEEAYFEVGNEVPNPEKTSNGTTTTTTNKPQNVSMTLKLTPHINKASRMIKLDIDNTAKDFSERPLNAVLESTGVATVNRAIKTHIIVRDKDTMAMGGLMRDKASDTIHKVPLLGDIPVLGWLFKTKEKKMEKANLLFFITPKILSPYETATANNVKDVLNRRSYHVKNTLGDEDPFGNTVKGLYEKAQKQSEGPLFDPESAKAYAESNLTDEEIKQQANEEKKKEEDKKKESETKKKKKEEDDDSDEDDDDSEELEEVIEAHNSPDSSTGGDNIQNEASIADYNLIRQEVNNKQAATKKE